MFTELLRKAGPVFIAVWFVAFLMGLTLTSTVIYILVKLAARL